MALTVFVRDAVGAGGRVASFDIGSILYAVTEKFQHYARDGFRLLFGSYAVTDMNSMNETYQMVAQKERYPYGSDEPGGAWESPVKEFKDEPLLMPEEECKQLWAYNPQHPDLVGCEDCSCFQNGGR
eukprot:gene34369-29963_t